MPGIEAKMEEKRTAIQKKLREEKMKKEVIDVTLPGKKVAVGHRHPNQIALDDLERVFIGMGYEVVEGPEVEYDHYNFELLNIPANHPAKDEQDTFYITKGHPSSYTDFPSAGAYHGNRPYANPCYRTRTCIPF